MSEEMLKEIKSEISDNKKVRVAINGFGRIGRMIFRSGFEDPNIEFVAINDISSPEVLKYLLKHDSAQGTFQYDVEIEGDYLKVGQRKIKVLAQKNVNGLPWEELNIDVVAECTGRFTNIDDARVHITQGARKVLISAPGKGECFYLVRGVNDDEYTNQDMVSNGSCTTNSMASIVNEIHKKYGVNKGMFATIHSVTGDQRILDTPHSNLRRGRAAPFNIIPTSTGAAKAVVRLIPELEGKLNGIAYRVPTITGSITDINLELKQNITKEELNQYLKELCKSKLNGIMEFSEEELVSSDIIGNSHSGIIDASSSDVVAGNLIKLAIWYDNEWGFSNRMVEVIKIMGNS